MNIDLITKLLSHNLPDDYEILDISAPMMCGISRVIPIPSTVCKNVGKMGIQILIHSTGIYEPQSSMFVHNLSVAGSCGDAPYVRYNIYDRLCWYAGDFESDNGRFGSKWMDQSNINGLLRIARGFGIIDEDFRSVDVSVVDFYESINELFCDSSPQRSL